MLPLNTSIQVPRATSRITFYEDNCTKYFPQTEVVPGQSVRAITVHFISQRIKLWKIPGLQKDLVVLIRH